MAISNPLSSTRGGGLLGTGIGAGTTYNYQPTEYQKYKEYTPYSSALGEQARGNLSQMMTGTLSDSTNQILQNQFKQNLAATREGAYGMPLGAQMGLETKAATENALSAAQLAEQQKQWAISQTLPYEQFGANQAYLGYESGSNENRYGQQWDQQQRDTMAAYSMQNKQDMNFGDLLGAGISTFSGNLLGGLGGGFASKLLGGK